MNKLSHVHEDGRAAMVDVSCKKAQLRIAKASGRIKLSKPTVALIAENRIKKGDVLSVAEISGIQAAKRTSDLIPLCHPIPLDYVNVKASLVEDGVSVTSEIRFTGRTGVEMEALTAVSVALLAIYDMCKAVDKNMKVENIVLVEKSKQDVE